MPLIERLQQAVGAEHVLVDPDVMAAYLVDWSRRFHGTARAVVRPGTTDEVASVVRACVEAGVPIHPQGGNTGLVGGSVPAPEHGPLGAPVVLSTRRLTRLDPVDGTAGQVTVGAGVTLAAVRAHAEAAGWEYGVDLAGRDSATIGGTLATNAGGIRVCRYGMTRRQVMGIEAVLPDGSVVSHLAGLDKDNTGYDLAGLLVGSEGTLGIITAVRLRLHPRPGKSTVVLVGVSGIGEALSLVRTCVRDPSRLLAAEVIDQVGMDAIMALDGLPWPLAQPWSHVLLIEVEDGGEGDGLDLPDHLDVVAGTDATSAARLWRYRDGMGEAFNSLGVPHRLDVSIPLSRIAEVSERVRAEVGVMPGVDVLGVFGHVADGNLHIEIVGPSDEDTRADIAVLRIVAAAGGSISAEHGVGRQKAAYLELCRSAEEIRAMRAIKASLDPRGLLAPGVIWPVGDPS